MVKVLPAIFSYENMKSKWNQDNPDNPYSRRDELQQGIYSLDKWLIRVDDNNKTIATIGWKEYPSHTVVGGLLAANRANPKRPEFEQGLGKNERALQSAREPQLNQSKPLIAAFGAREGSPEAWIQRGRNRGWVFSQDEEFSQIKSSIPESVTNEWNSAYPNGNWAIRLITDAESLSKWVFIDDPTPSWFNLLKYLPDNTWDDFQLGEPTPDLGTRDRFKDKNIKSKGKAEYKAFVSEQYLRQVSDRIPNAGTSLMEGWLKKLNQLKLNKGKYWFFGTNVKEDRTYVTIDIIQKGSTYTQTGQKKFNLDGMELAIVFIGVSKEMVGKIKRGQGIPKGRKFIDIHGNYGLRGLTGGRRKMPKEPVNVFKKSWKDILKVLPPSDWTPYPYREIDPESNNKTPREINIGDTKYVASGHYITAVYGRNNHGTSNRNTTDFEKWVNCVKGLGKGKYWMYANDSPTQRHIILIDIIGQGDKFPGSAYGKTVNTTVTNDEGKPVKKVVIFRNYFNKMPSEIMQRKRIDCYPGIKLKRGHEYISGRFVEVDPNKEQEEEQSAPTVSREELVENAKQKVNKILQTEINFNLPQGHVKTMIENIIQANRKRKIYMGKKQRKEVDDALEVIY